MDRIALRNRQKDRSVISLQRGRRPNFDRLEERQLMTTGFDLYPSGASNRGTAPAIVQGSDGNLWYSNNTLGVSRITPDGHVTQFSTITPDGSESVVSGLTLNHKDGNIWFTEAGYLGSISPQGTVKFVAIPDGHVGLALTADNGGNLWFVNETGNVEKYQTSSGSFSVVTLPNASSNFVDQAGITTTADGSVWVTEFPSVKLSPTQDSWGVVGAVDRIGTAGDITTTTLLQSYDSRIGLTAGPDGSLWFVDYGGRTVGTIKADGTVSKFSLTASASSITAGPDGALWFTLPNSSNGPEIGRATLDGTISYYVPAADSSLARGNLGAIATGSDGALWFTVTGIAAIGRLDASTPAGTDIPVVTHAPVIVVAPIPIPSPIKSAPISGPPSQGSGNTNTPVINNPPFKDPKTPVVNQPVPSGPLTLRQARFEAARLMKQGRLEAKSLMQLMGRIHAARAEAQAKAEAQHAVNTARREAFNMLKATAKLLRAEAVHSRLLSKLRPR